MVCLEYGRGVLIFQRGNQNSQIEGQTTQWPKSKKDAMVRRQSTNNDLQNTTQKTKDRISRNPFKTEGSSDAPEG